MAKRRFGLHGKRKKTPRSAKPHWIRLKKVGRRCVVILSSGKLRFVKSNRCK